MASRSPLPWRSWGKYPDVMVPACTVFTTIECITNNISIPYKVEKIDISKNTQKEDWFLAINPNGRIPALTDKFTDGQTINLFESGSIMQYLVERYDTDHKISYPKGSREWYEMNNWLFFQNAGVGPMQGQASTDAQPGRHAT
jgi:glutathione S-transferase